MPWPKNGWPSLWVFINGFDISFLTADAQINELFGQDLLAPHAAIIDVAGQKMYLQAAAIE